DKTLEELLEEPDLLQELHAPNTKLIEFLRSPEIMVQMIKCIADMNHKVPVKEQHEEKKEGDKMEVDDDSEVAAAVESAPGNMTNIKKQIRLLNRDDDDEEDDDNDSHNQSFDSENDEDENQL